MLLCSSLSNVPIYGWTDSTITSAWLKQHPSKWNIYIANHVSEGNKLRYRMQRDITFLQRKTSPIAPLVDCRRQCYYRMICGGTAPFWWSAPFPLGQNPTWSSDVSRRDDYERNFHKSAKDYRTSIELCEWVGIAPTIFRAGLGYSVVLRFFENSKHKRISQFGKELPFNVSDLREVAQFWFRFVQKAHFRNEWKTLSNNEPIRKSSALKPYASWRFVTSAWRVVAKGRSRMFRETFYHTAAALHLCASHHKSCASGYSSWWHAIYAAHFKIRILDHRRPKSPQDAYPSMCDLRTSIGQIPNSTNGRLRSEVLLAKVKREPMPIVTSKPETKLVIKQKYSSQFFPEIARQNAERTPRHSWFSEKQKFLNYLIIIWSIILYVHIFNAYYTMHVYKMYIYCR